MRLGLVPMFLGVLVLGGLGAVEGAPTPTSLPPLRLRSLDGKAFQLDSLLGKVVVLDVWAPWCVPCRASFPRLEALQATLGPKGVQVVGMTFEDDAEGIRAFLDAVPVSFPIAIDPSGAAGEALGVVAMPTTFLLDREGKITARFEGGDRKVHSRLEEAIKALLSGKSLGPESGARIPSSLQATGTLKAWKRGFLADPLMNLDGDPISKMFHEHIHASKEAAAGDGGASGGGCGCN